MLTKQEKNLDNILPDLKFAIYFFAGVIGITLIGFFPTYLIKFPSFDGFKTVHHFHGAIMMIWLIMLVVQPLLIKYKKIAIHRIIGKLSYFVFPLLILSFYLVAKAGYERNILNGPEREALAGLASGIPDMFFMTSLYVLAIYNKKNTFVHLRYFTAIGLMVLGPGLGRLIILSSMILSSGLEVMNGIIVTLLVILGIIVAWLISDIVKKKPYIPMVTILIITLTAIFILANSNSVWWQAFAKWIVNNLF
jgi:hypothetical protein